MYLPGPTMKPIACDPLIPANAPVLSFSVVAADTYDLQTAALPSKRHVELFQNIEYVLNSDTTYIHLDNLLFDCYWV